MLLLLTTLKIYFVLDLNLQVASYLRLNVFEANKDAKDSIKGLVREQQYSVLCIPII